MISFEWFLLYVFLGTFVGFMGGLLGVGGGGILVPLLATLLAYQGVSSDNVVHLALGTSLASMIVSSLASIRAHGSRKTIILRIAWGMGPGILIGAFATTSLAVRVNSTYIAVFFALFMALIAVQMFMNWKPKVNHKPSTFFDLFAVGIVIGSISSLAAVGGGFLTVMYLSYKNIGMKEAVGTSAAIGLPIAVAGTLGYMINGWAKTYADSYTFGFIYLPAFLIISIASAIAAPYGARCSYNLPEIYLKRIFAVLSLILSLKMLLQVY